MKLRELFENIYEQNGEEFDGSLKVIGVCFGRWNPPHRGHKEVWKAASANPIWYVGTNENTTGPKDPLPYDVKLQCMAAVWPGVAQHVIPEQSLLTLATRIYEEHGANVHFKVYTDEEWLYKTLVQYNGVSDKPHGTYKFTQIDWVRTERLASATNLRAAVRAGDREGFYKDMGIKPSVTIDVNGKDYPVFDVVAHYLNAYPEKAKKTVAESSDDRKQNVLWAQITAHEKAAKKSKDLKQQHHLKMADQLRSQLKTSDQVDEIAGAFPSPSTKAKWAADAAASNAAEAKRLAAKQAQQLQQNTAEVDRQQKINHHSLAPDTVAPIPANEASGYIPKNKKEAKDPRWSTALTQDVKIGAIGKNLRAFKLAEQIKQLEQELVEATQKKISKRVQQATAGLNTFGDSEKVSGDYVGYRLGLAVACADGKNPIDMKAKSWIGKKKSTHPYTKEEQDMLKQAYKAVGASYKDVNGGDMKSKELDSTNKASPVAKPKKNRYGV